MRSIILIGPRCPEYALVGTELAKQSKRIYIDGDRRFQEKYGQIERFTESNGWKQFREKESIIIKKICDQYINEGIVFFPGEEAVANLQKEECRENNVKTLRDFGMLFYLLPSPHLAGNQQRFAARWTPGHSPNSNLRNQKRDLYSKVAHKTICIGKLSQPEIINNILAAVSETDVKAREILDTLYKRKNEISEKHQFIVLNKRGHNLLLMKRDGFYVRNYREKESEQIRRFERSPFTGQYYYGSIFNRTELLDIFNNIEPQRLEKHFNSQL